MVQIRYTGDELWRRIQRGVDKVKERLERVTRALDTADIPYAVIGGNAVQLWVAQVDESAVRNTRDVDIVLNRSDLDAACRALTSEGFIFRQAAGVTMFLDGPGAKARDAVHVIFSGEKVRPEYLESVPPVIPFERMKNVRTLPLAALVTMKLTSFRDKDKVHVRDMLDVGLLDTSWLQRIPESLRSRLQTLIDDPDG